MDVTFRRTGERRYAVVAEPEDHPAVTMDPAPGFDPEAHGAILDPCCAAKDIDGACAWTPSASSEAPPEPAKP